ncbi:MAG TPA: hypothetical protein VEA69_10435 [Tepidisphaeraceae bacterium]|nr:hypothetical protein [Tepidisphaeraceae bacterium]
MSGAILGLVGVLIGATISALTTYINSSRQERFARERAAADRLAETQRAARMVEYDLSHLRGICVSALDWQYFLNSYGDMLELPRWAKWCEMLALHLPADDWETITCAAIRGDAVKVMWEKDANSGFPPFDSARKHELAGIVELIEFAIDQLSKYTGVKSPRARALEAAATPEVP